MTDNNDKQIDKLTDKQTLPELTDKNIKFYRLIQSGISIVDAYKGAGYEGKSPDAPYALYNNLKKRLLVLQEAESNIDSLRLRSQLSQLLSLPLAQTEITIKDKLNAIKLTHQIVEGTKQESSPNITAFVINTGNGQANGHDDNVVDVVEVKPDQEQKDNTQS